MSKKEYLTNEERTQEYLKSFNREKVLKNLIKESKPVIFDIGSNDGLSLKEFKSWWHDSVVHCFEPQHECLSKLKARALKYDKSSVFISETAVGDTPDRDVSFYSHAFSSGSSGFNRINTDSVDSIHLRDLKIKGDNSKLGGYYEDINNERKVDIIRIDEYMNNLSIDHIDLMKIDTQGFEPEVLSGVGDRLKDVNVIVTELMFYDYYDRKLSFTDIEQFLLPSGFEIYDISHISKNPMNGRTDWVDVIYVNSIFFNSLK
jgi:FkbM family methyltransferase